MTEFELFKKVIVGKFNNLEQVKMEKEKGKVIHPISKHVNAICNDKIDNLPVDFKGIFVIEESYYTFVDTNRSNTMPHLFLFKETEEGKVKLISYEIPKDISKKDFNNSNANLRFDYNKLEISEKFNHFTYNYIKGIGFHGKSLSQFAPDTTFFLDETLSEDKLEVNEILKKGDKVLVGFESPILYIREL